MGKKIFFWKGAIAEKGLLEECSQDLEDILRGNYSEDDLKILKGTSKVKIYRYKTNKKFRLLLTEVKVDGELQLLLLEKMDDHKYENQSILDSKILKRYLANNGEAISQAGKEDMKFGRLDHVPEWLKPTEEEQQAGAAAAPAVTIIPVDYYHRQFIRPNDAQKGTLASPFPLVVTGGAGSGKTCIAVWMVAEHVDMEKDKDEADRGKALIVVGSKILANETNNILSEFMPTKAPDGMIEIKTYDELLEGFGLLVGKTKVDKAYFDQWYKAEAARYNQQVKAERKGTHGAAKNLPIKIDNQTAYQEFRICAGNTLSDYLKLGEEQSRLPKTEREWIYTTYTRYMVHLEDKHSIHPEFYQTDLGAGYKLVIYDEAQNATKAQIAFVSSLAIDNKIAMFMDRYQAMFDVISKEQEIITTLQKRAEHVHIHRLTTSYRCRPLIAEAANEVIKMWERAAGGKIDKNAPGYITTSAHLAGGAGYVAKLTEEDLNSERAKAMGQNPDFAIIVPDEFSVEKIDALKAQFKTQFVWKVNPAQGLEYKKVLLIGFLSAETFKALRPYLEKGGEQPKNRAGKNDDTSGLVYGPFFGKLFTAITRASEKVLFATGPSPDVEHFLRNIKALPFSEMPEDEAQGDWSEAIKRLYLHGFETEALQLAEEKLGMDATAYRLSIGIEPPSPAPSVAASAQPSSAKNTTIPSLLPKAIVENLIKNFTKKNLNAYLESDDVESRLFNKWVDQKDHESVSLFEFICQKKGREDLFMQCMQNPALLDKAILFRIATEPEGINFLLQLLRQHPNIFQKLIPLNTWYTPIKEPSNITFLLFLSGRKGGASFLNNLFKKIPGLYKQIPERCWNEPDSSGLNTTVVYNLSFEGDGDSLAILTSLIEDNVSISGETLALARPEAAGPLEHMTPIFLLSRTAQTRRLLSEWLKKCPNLFDKIPGTVLSLALTRQAEIYENFSPLLYLSSFEDGIAVLTTLLKVNPGLFLNEEDSLPCQDWGRRVRSEARHLSKYLSPLHAISANKSGHAFLFNLFVQHPELVFLIPIEFWFHLDEKTGSIPIYSLLESDTGWVVFVRLCIMNDDIFAKITPSRWRDILIQQNKDTKLSGLHGLMKSTHGLVLLDKLLSKYPEEMKSLPSKIWLTEDPRTKETPISLSVKNTNKSSSLLHVSSLDDPEIIMALGLAQSLAIGRAALATTIGQLDPTKVVRNLILEFTAEKLTDCLKRPDVASCLFGKWATPRSGNSYSLLAFICNDKAKANIFIKCMQNEGLVEHIVTEAFVEQLGLTSKVQPKRIWNLNDDLLLKIVSSQHSLLKLPAIKTWLSLSLNSDYIQILAQLLTDSSGQKLLLTLISQYQEVILNIKSYKWENTLSVLGLYAIMTQITSDKMEFLTRLVESYPEIFEHYVHPNVWYLPIVALDSRINLLQVCSEFRGGIYFLDALFTKCPIVRATIPSNCWAIITPKQMENGGNTTIIGNLLRGVNEERDQRPALDILRTLIEKDNLSFPGEILALERPSKAAAYENTSPIFSLSCTDTARQLFSWWLERNPHLLDKVPGRVLGSALTKQAGIYENFSALFHFSSFDDGIVILETLLKIKPDLFFGKEDCLPAEAWTRQIKSEARHLYEYLSPLHALSTRKSGHTFLFNLFETHHKLAFVIASEAWFDLDGTTMPIYSLLGSDIGWKVFLFLCNKNEAIFAGITPSLWENILRWPEEETGLSRLHGLMKSPLGLTFLNKLISKYPDEMKRIPSETWLTEDPNTKETPLSLVVRSNDIAILGFLRKNFENDAVMIAAMDLVQPDKASALPSMEVTERFRFLGGKDTPEGSYFQPTDSADTMSTAPQ